MSRRKLFDRRAMVRMGWLFCCLVTGAHGQDEVRLPREELLLWRDASGQVQPVRSVADWEQRRQEIVRGMEAVMGPLPGQEKRCPLDVKVEEEVDCGTYVRQTIRYQAEPGPGGSVPAYLCVPKKLLLGQARHLAVLCLHPTDDVVGNGVVVGLGGKANRQYASELAERGYVTISPNYPLLAKYRPDLKALGYASGTMKAIWDNIRALDLLDSLPEVKSGVFGAIGHSLGGHNSVYTAVMDPRIRVVVSSCGLDSYVDYYGGDPAVWKPGKGWCSERYMPALLRYAGRLDQIPYDFAELLGALAPRAVFISAPVGDGNFQWRSVGRIAAAAKPIYDLYPENGGLEVEHPDCGHDFPDAIRLKAYRKLDEVLLDRRN